MWTPKRVLLLLAGFALFAAAYVCYARYLGGIDGLTPLPEAYQPGDVTDDPPPVVYRDNLANKKIKQAFGEASPELGRSVKLDMPTRGLVLAVEDFKILEEDPTRVKLVPFSIAIFKNRADGGFPEINTVRCQEAILQLDKGIKTIAEIGSRKIIGGELYRDIQLVNNRGTPQVSDDLSLYTKGPVYFSEQKHLIWTETEVKLTDIKTEPEPTSITATGMDVYLKTENTPAKGAGGKPAKKGERISDVERIELRSNVRMDLWAEQGAGFLSTEKEPGKGGARAEAVPQFVGPPAPPPRAKIVITTDGKFSYDLGTSLARFDIPPRPNPLHPEIVRVVRENENDQGKRDQLECDHLELQFVRKDAKARPGRSDSPGDSLEIESAHAVGKSLTLTSDAEALTAFGSDLFYDASKRQSKLKGDPMVALKDGNEIHARELWMGPDGPKGAQQATAIGPGNIAMLERTVDGTRMARTLQARWNDKLIHTKDGAFDVLTLTGAAAFDDPRNGQRLKAEFLKVWLEPGPADGPDDAGQKRLKPHHIEAKGRVSADGPDLHVLEPTEHLVIWFKDVAALPGAPKDHGPAPAPAGGVARAEAGGPHQSLRPAEVPPCLPPAAAGPVASAPTANNMAPPSAPTSPVKSIPTIPAGTSPAGPPAPAEDKPKPPINLSARSVEVFVLRSGQKSDLDRLFCEGTVHVHQEPESPKDDGMDIQGDTLNLNNHPEGGVLLVEGKPADVRFNKMAIVGPKVNIDQRENKAWVEGIGLMRMLSETNFDGQKLTQPTVLTVQWKKSMLFTGKNAEFVGGVQAEQENSRLLCQGLQVSFDRTVNLKEGNKGGPPPKVDRMLCDQNVEVEEKTFEGKQLISIRRLISPGVNLDNADKEVNVSGPGEVRIFQLGTADDWKPGTPTAQPPAKPGGTVPAGKSEAKSEYKITHVRFQGKMWGKTVEPRKVTFWGDNGGVEAIHVPADRPDLVIDVDKPPPGCMYIRCSRMEVLTNRLPDGRASQEMKAFDKVLVQAQEFWGNADEVSYDEAADRVIFKGTPDAKAVLYRVTTPGKPPDKTTGVRIYYYRKTNSFNVEGSDGLISH